MNKAQLELELIEEQNQMSRDNQLLIKHWSNPNDRAELLALIAEHESNIAQLKEALAKYQS